MYQQPDPAQIQHMMTAMMPVFFFFTLLWMAVVVVPFWFIFRKAGFNGALSLLMIVPLVNLVVLYVLAFSRWRVVPTPEYGMYPPPPGYPGYPVQPPQPGYPPTGYAQPGATVPVGYPSPPSAPADYVPPTSVPPVNREP